MTGPVVNAVAGPVVTGPVVTLGRDWACGDCRVVTGPVVTAVS